MPRCLRCWRLGLCLWNKASIRDLSNSRAMMAGFSCVMKEETWETDSGEM